MIARRLEVLVADEDLAELDRPLTRSASTSSLWPLPETLAMPTISPASL
jgi:hypothetical protein